MSLISPLAFAVWVTFGAVVIVSIGDVAPSFTQLAEGLPRMLSLLRTIP